MRMRACAEKGLESATECGRFHAGRAASRKVVPCALLRNYAVELAEVQRENLHDITPLRFVAENSKARRPTSNPTSLG